MASPLMAQTCTDQGAGPVNVAPKFAGVVANSKKLIITMGLDRDVYFPGEAIRLTMKATNPTPQIMEVFDPFQGGCVDVMAKRGGGYAPFSPHPQIERGPCWSTQTVWLSPNQELRYDSRSREFQAGGPGEYRLHLEAWAASDIDYTVVAPEAENYASVEISRDKRFPTHARYVHVAVLRWKSERFLVVSDEASTLNPRLITKPTGEDNDMVAQIGPYVRARKLNGSIAELQVTADKDDTAVLRWRPDAGPWTALELPGRGRKTAYEVLRAAEQ